MVKSFDRTTTISDIDWLTVPLSTMYYYIAYYMARYSSVPYGISYYKFMVKALDKKKSRYVNCTVQPLSTMYYYIVRYSTVPYGIIL